MADIREAILAQLLVIARAVPGVAAVVRIAVDVPGLARPAIVLHDGAEQVRDVPANERRARIQRVEMTPQLDILVAAAAADAGTLLNTYRVRLIYAVINDDALWALVEANGEIRYEGCQVEPATAESKEYRMAVNLVFTYTFRVTDLLT